MSLVSVRHQLRNPATLLGNATYTSPLFPIKGARYAVVRFKSTDPSDTLATTSFTAGFDTSLIFSGTSGSISPHLVPIGVATGNRMNGGEGVIQMFLPPPAQVHQNRILVGWMAVSCTVTGGATPGNDVSGFEVVVDVFYESGEDPTGLSGSVTPN